MGYRSLLTVSAAICALGIGAGMARAQSSPGSDALEEVTVSANKRTEKLAEVPASIIVFTDKDLENQNVKNFEDLVNIAPDLTITNPSNLANATPNIRGIGTYSFGIGAQASVAVITDDAPAGKASVAFSSMPDIQQIEVLRGPQSTLFGISADAGAIYITTKAPGNTFAAHGEAWVTSDDEKGARALVSGPVSNTLKLGLAVNDSNYQGNVYNIRTENWLNGHNAKLIRAHILWEPSADWTVSLIPHVSSDSINGNASVYTTFYGLTTFGKASLNLPIAKDLGGVVPGPDNRQTAMGSDPRNTQEDAGAVLKISHDLANGMMLTSTTSFDHYNFNDVVDQTGSAYNWALSYPAGTAIGNGDQQYYTYFHNNSATQDFRLVSPQAGPLHYVAGVFLSYLKNQTYFVKGNAVDFGLMPAATAQPFTSAITSIAYQGNAKIRTEALYTEDSYDITDQLSIRAGARVHHEGTDMEFTDIYNHVAYGEPACQSGSPTLTVTTCTTQTVLTGKGAVEYKVTPNINVFADASTGFKGKAFDATSALTTRTLLTAGPYKGYPTGDVIMAQQPIPGETVQNYEFGYKAALFDHKLTWNSTVFFEQLQNFQVSYTDPNTLVSELQSVPSISTRGAETELAIRPISGLTVTTAGSYDIAKVNNWTNAPCYPNQTVGQGCINHNDGLGAVQNLSGGRLANAPKWRMNFNAEEDLPINDDYTLVFDAAYRWQSSIYFATNQDPGSLQKGYGIANLAAGVQAEHWKAMLSVNNVFDKYYATYQARSCVQCTINPFGATAGKPISDAIVSAPARDSARYVMFRISADY